MLCRLPSPALRPFVDLVWCSDNARPSPYAQPMREHVLPTGKMHLVVCLSPHCVRLLHASDGATLTSSSAQTLAGAVIGGVRSGYYARELLAPSASVGVVLRPEASTALLGVPAQELSERHTPLELAWGAEATRLHERLLDATNAEQRLSIVEAVLISRLPRVRGLHPAIACVLDEMTTLPSIETAVRKSGLSHRMFITHFRQSLGLNPKQYLQVLRFQQALQGLRAGGAQALAALAADAGYSDQAHFNRDFKAYAGVTPLTYLSLRPKAANHLPMDAGTTKDDSRASARHRE